MVLTLREAIAAWVRSLSSLTPLVAGRVYKQDPSQVSKYPCVVIEQPTRDYGMNHSGADGTSWATVQLTAMALFESQSVAIAEVIRNNCQGFRGMQSGVAIMRCYLDDEADGTTPPVAASDRWIYQVAITYRIQHRVPMPTSVTQTNV